MVCKNNSQSADAFFIHLTGALDAAAAPVAAAEKNVKNLVVSGLFTIFATIMKHIGLLPHIIIAIILGVTLAHVLPMGVEGRQRDSPME